MTLTQTSLLCYLSPQSCQDWRCWSWHCSVSNHKCLYWTFFSYFMFLYFFFFYSLCVHSSLFSLAWKTTHPESKHDLYSCTTLDYLSVSLALSLGSQSGGMIISLLPACFSFHWLHSVLLPPDSTAAHKQKRFGHVEVDSCYFCPPKVSITESFLTNTDWLHQRFYKSFRCEGLLPHQLLNLVRNRW